MIKTTICLTVTLVCLGIAEPVFAQKQGTANGPKTDVKFLEDITLEPGSVQAASAPYGGGARPKTEAQPAAKKEFGAVPHTAAAGSPAINIEEADRLQFKYALLLDTEVEMIASLPLFKAIDEWMGTRYQYGGAAKTGVDCSALMQALFTSFYGMTLPRTAKEQFNYSRPISRAELKEGDLLFFNTSGGISHVGMYLQNNKFVHASSSGVTISDLDEAYYSKRFVGAGRVEPVKTESIPEL